MKFKPGFRVVFMEYRGYGNNESLGSPSLTKILNDAEDVYASLVDSDAKMIVMGRSIGTIPAVHLAGKYPYLGTLILDSGMCDPLAGVSRKPANPISLSSSIEGRLKSHHDNLKNFKGVLLQLHCNDDATFPGDQALSVFRIASGKDDVKYVREVTNQDSQADVYKHERVTLALFVAGGHNYIWALNWRLYSQYILQTLVDRNDDWWPKKSKVKKETCSIH